jgi:protein gp37
MYKRFGWNEKLSFNLYEPGVIDHLMRLRPKPNSRIFVCSTMELFHPAVLDKWRKDIFAIIEENPKLTFIILTKMPERIDRPMPDNVWLGVSAEGVNDWCRVRELSKINALTRFVSLEPFIGESPGFGPPREFDWLIIGRLTGHGRKHNPNPKSIRRIVSRVQALGIPVFLKNNIREIWGRPLIQEFPAPAIPHELRGLREE